jgi:hypothetical protein
VPAEQEYARALEAVAARRSRARSDSVSAILVYLRKALSRKQLGMLPEWGLRGASAAGGGGDPSGWAGRFMDRLRQAPAAGWPQYRLTYAKWIAKVDRKAPGGAILSPAGQRGLAAAAGFLDRVRGMSAEQYSASKGELAGLLQAQVRGKPAAAPQGGTDDLQALVERHLLHPAAARILRQRAALGSS